MTELDDGGGGGGGGGASVEDFISTGRAGRRNALADIMDSRCGSTSTAGLPNSLAKLSCSGMYSKEGMRQSESYHNLYSTSILICCMPSKWFC